MGRAMAEDVCVELTERERTILEHLKQAQELKTSLADYAKAFDVKLTDLYNGKAQLIRKGAWAPSTAERGEPERAQLLAVQVLPEVKASEAATSVCRITAPSGWVIEFGQWPD